MFFLILYFTAVNCTDPGIPERCNRTGELSYGKSMKYTCHNGYYITAGDWSLMCLANGTWDGEPPTCSSKSC